MSERILPGDPDMERLFLGGLMNQQEQFPLMKDMLSADDFLLEKHRLIFHAMTEVYASGDSIDYRMVFERLRKSGHDRTVDGLSYLVSMSDGLPQIYGLDGYCKQIRDKGVLRRAMLWADNFAQRCELANDPGDLLAEAEKLTNLVSESQRTSSIAMTPFEVQEAEGGINAFLSPYTQPGIELPFSTINRTLSGLRRFKLIILAGRPATGKSAFAFQVAEHAAMRGGHRVLFVSLEMSARDLLHRAIPGRASVSAYKFRHGELNPEEWSAVQHSWTELVDLDDKLLICDRADTTIQSLSALIRTLISRGKRPELVVIDYIQICKIVGRYENRTQEVAAISRGLLSIAREFDLPLVALSQMSRNSERESREPNLSDLKETSQLEQDAHQVIFLWAKDDAQNENEPTRLVNWKIAKNRDGMLNRGKLVFQRRYARFYEAEEPYQEVA